MRSLGPEGKKRGTTSTLPLALGRLQTRGLIRRVPTDGRLDQQRYRYVAWTPSPLGKKTLGDDEIAIELARRFFRWAGPATVAQLAWWGGLGVKASRAAAAELGLVPGAGSDRLLFGEDLDALLSVTIPREPRISFVSSLDNILHPRRELLPHLDDADVKRGVPGAGQKELVGSLVDLPYHPIVDRGRVIGLWDWDGVKGALAWRTFTKTTDVEKRVAKEAEALAEHVARDLGDVRSFSLDSPESRVPRIKDLLAAKW